MQDIRKDFCRLVTMILVRHIGKDGDHLRKKRGLTLCYNCRRPGHLAKKFFGRRPSCLCCKAMDHEVLDLPRMIAKIDRMNMRQENLEKGHKTEAMVEPQIESETVLLQIKDTLNDHKNINLSEIFKEKECIESRIGDFDIDYVLDEET
jgi:hypothetical protein